MPVVVRVSESEVGYLEASGGGGWEGSGGWLVVGCVQSVVCWVGRAVQLVPVVLGWSLVGGGAGWCVWMVVQCESIVAPFVAPAGPT